MTPGAIDQNAGQRDRHLLRLSRLTSGVLVVSAFGVGAGSVAIAATSRTSSPTAAITGSGSAAAPAGANGDVVGALTPASIDPALTAPTQVDPNQQQAQQGVVAPVVQPAPQQAAPQGVSGGSGH